MSKTSTTNPASKLNPLQTNFWYNTLFTWEQYDDSFVNLKGGGPSGGQR